MPQLRPIAILSAILIVSSFLLGLWGFSILDSQTSSQNLVYLALRLFPIDGPINRTELPIQLEIARFSAPFSLLLGILATVCHISRDLLNNALLRFSREHVIIVGLNEISVGLAEDAITAGRKVVVIDDDQDNPLMHEIKAKGAVCLLGSLNNSHSLRRARIQRASHFFAFTHDDGCNVELIMMVSEILSKNARTPAEPEKLLNCYTLLQDSNFQKIFKEHSLLNSTSDAMSVSLVNLEELVARVTLEELPMEVDSNGKLHDQNHIVIFGHSSIGMAILRHALRLGHYRTRTQLKVSLVTSQPEVFQRQLNRYFPLAKEIAYIEVITAEDDTPASYYKALETSISQPHSWSTLACMGQCDRENFAIAKYLSIHAHAFPGRILCSLPSSPGLISLLNSKSSGRHIHALQRLAELSNWQTIVNEPHETRARTIHRNYVDLELAKEKSPYENGSLVSWEALPEATREQNRLQADHIPVKLRAIGVDIDLLPDKEVLQALLTENLELLAEMEHLRWNAVQFLAGWKYAPGKKDPEKLTHPCLVPWNELTDEIKQYDRDAVMNLPNLTLPRSCRH